MGRISLSQREPQSTDVRRLLASAFVNSLGNGFVIPFLFVYLHDEVGLSYAVSGLVIASNGFAAILAAPVVGAAIDRFGAHVVIVCALIASAVGYSSSSPWTTRGRHSWRRSSPALAPEATGLPMGRCWQPRQAMPSGRGAAATR